MYNPERVLYGRIPGYHLSELGHKMADVAAASLTGHPVRALYSSPLQRTQESAAPWAKRFGLDIVTDDRLIEPHNWFEGKRMREAIRRPDAWPRLVWPFRPSWGEPFVSVRERMLAAVTDAWNSVDSGEVVMVSHQMPIVTVSRSVRGKPLFHDPRQRRCSLSSITTLRREGDRFVEASYQEPARDLLAASIDLGAV